MMGGDAKKVREIRPDLVSMVSGGDLTGAYALLEATIGNLDVRGWGWPFEPTADLMRRIMVICPGQQGVELAVEALCGHAIYGPGLNIWKQARYEQDLESWRQTSFIVGVQWGALDWSCDAGKQKAGCYRLADAPPFLTPDCWMEEEGGGCCCGWLELMEGNEPPTPWRK